MEYIVIPQYEEVKWQREYYFVVRNGKYGVYNNKDEKLLNCEYDELKAWYGGIRLRKNGKYGIYYALGTGNLIQCEYDEVEYHNGYYILSQNGKYKLAYSGRLLAGYHFDKYICDSGYRSGIIVSKNNKYGIVYKDEFITAPIYDEYMSSFKYPESIIVRLNEKYGLYYRNNLVLKCEYDDLKINTPIIHKGKYGLVLEDGTIALDFIYDEIKLYKDHYYVIKNGKYSLYNSQHRRVENRWVDTEDAIRKSIDVEIMIKDFEYIQPITLKKFF